MTVQEFYNHMGGGYENMYERVGDDHAIAMFLRRIKDDYNYQDLCKAVAYGDKTTTYDAAHALKGLAANFELFDLYVASMRLVRQLREGDNGADDTLFHNVQEEYQKAIDAIEQIDDI